MNKLYIIIILTKYYRLMMAIMLDFKGGGQVAEHVKYYNKGDLLFGNILKCSFKLDSDSFLKS